MSSLVAEAYLGDGAYVEYRGWDICIYVSNGISQTDKVYLDGVGVERLISFLRDVVGVGCLQGVVRADEV